jgi:hypothetical protein
MRHKKQGKHERTGKKVMGTARFGIGNCVSICIKLLWLKCPTCPPAAEDTRAHLASKVGVGRKPLQPDRHKPSLGLAIESLYFKKLKIESLL